MGYRDDLASGRVAFAHLIRVWHERNGWSHRVLPAVAETLDLGRVHNSQLSMLRNGKLAAPGPEVFWALGRINQLLALEVQGGRLSESLRLRLQTQPEVVQALAALLNEGGNGRIRSRGGKQLDFTASNRKKRGHDPFRDYLFALVGSDSEQPRVEDFGGVEVEHGYSEMLDSEPMG